MFRNIIIEAEMVNNLLLCYDLHIDETTNVL
jgi:hypothetical protein